MNEPNQSPDGQNIIALEEEVLKLEQEVKYAGTRLEGAQRLYEAYFSYVMGLKMAPVSGADPNFGANYAYKRGNMRVLVKLQRPLLEETARMRDEFNRAEATYSQKQEELRKLKPDSVLCKPHQFQDS